MNYDLNRSLYSSRYFYTEDDPRKILNGMNKFLKDLVQPQVTSITINNRSHHDGDELVRQWDGTIVYYGSNEMTED